MLLTEDEQFIEDVISAHPEGIKATTIEAETGINEKRINRYLYSKKLKFHVDSSYRWFFRDKTMYDIEEPKEPDLLEPEEPEGEEENSFEEKTVIVRETILVNQELLMILKEWRKKKANENHSPLYFIENSVLEEIASRESLEKGDLLDIRGFGQTLYSKYADEIFKIFCDFYGIENTNTIVTPPVVVEKKPERVCSNCCWNGNEDKCERPIHKDFFAKECQSFTLKGEVNTTAYDVKTAKKNEAGKLHSWD